MANFRILAIDGGGIRGIIPATWLARLEERLQSPLYQHFDLIVGTSTGSLLAAGVATGISAHRFVSLYEEHGEAIFRRSFPWRHIPWSWSYLPWDWLSGALAPRYGDKALTKILQDTFETKALQHAYTPLLITSYDVYLRKIFPMRSYDALHRSIPLWEACKASCSAPTYFPAHLLTHGRINSPLIDGGVFANNPAVLGIAEAIKISNKSSIRQFHENSQISMVSLGTGSLQQRLHHKYARKMGKMSWGRHIISVLFDSSSDLSDFCAQTILTNDRYVRLQFDLQEENEALDNASKENILQLKLQANDYLDDGPGEIALNRIVALLTT